MIGCAFLDLMVGWRLAAEPRAGQGVQKVAGTGRSQCCIAVAVLRSCATFSSTNQSIVDEAGCVDTCSRKNKEWVRWCADAAPPLSSPCD